MEISFKTTKLKKLCDRKGQAERELGTEMAKKLRARLSDLKAVSTVAELCAGHPHPLTGDRKGEFALSIGHLQRLVFEPANDPIPRKNDESNKDKVSKDQDSKDEEPEDTSIDWGRVTRIRIVWIGDYHD